MAIIVEGVNKYYGSQKALNDVNFTLGKGNICGFLGPNGAGKSTMMKIITGYLTDYGGHVSLEGTDIRDEPLKAKAQIGYLPEHNPLYPDMYIREYLLHVARLYSCTRAKQRVSNIIELTGLLPEVQKKIGQLSKGYRQRVGLAQALIHDPEVLILDEPMTGLDPNQLEEIRNLIIEVGKNKTVLLSTHIMQEVEAICDRIIIINKGEIVADKPKSEIYSLTSGSLTIYARFASDCDTGWLVESNLFEKTVLLSENAWQLVAKANHDPRIELFNTAALHHCPIIELKSEEHNLEDIFRQLTL